MNDVDARLDVREGVRRGEDGFPFVLLDQVAVRSAVQRERRAVHEGAQVVVLVKVGDPLLQLVGVEERLHVGDLEVGLEHKEVQRLHNVHTAALLHTHTHAQRYLVGIQFVFVYRIGVLDYFDHVIAKPLRVELLCHKVPVLKLFKKTKQNKTRRS